MFHEKKKVEHDEALILRNESESARNVHTPKIMALAVGPEDVIHKFIK